MHKEHETVIETVLAWLAGWWPLLALPGAFTIGCATGWWFGREDRLYLQRSWERAAAHHSEAQAEANDLRGMVDDYRRDWQALRAIVEQHTVKP